MSTDPVQAASESDTGESPGTGRGQPSEEELRAAYEAEMSRISSVDMILQATVSLLNIGGHRLGLSAEPDRSTGARDLEQVRDAIDGARALLGILERRRPEDLRPLRDALAQLQMAYAREAGASGPPAGAEQAPDPAKAEESPSPEQPQGPGPAESSGRLWVPGR